MLQSVHLVDFSICVGTALFGVAQDFRSSFVIHGLFPSGHWPHSCCRTHSRVCLLGDVDILSVEEFSVILLLQMDLY